MLGTAAAAMEATAGGMAGSATATTQRAAAVAAAAGQSSAGVQMVAAASEELAASIGEINRQVACVATLSGRAVGGRAPRPARRWRPLPKRPPASAGSST
nr:hypothetical protein [uncultured Lichenicoccus sp.]